MDLLSPVLYKNVCQINVYHINYSNLFSRCSVAFTLKNCSIFSSEDTLHYSRGPFPRFSVGISSPPYGSKLYFYIALLSLMGRRNWSRDINSFSSCLRWTFSFPLCKTFLSFFFPVRHFFLLQFHVTYFYHFTDRVAVEAWRKTAKRARINSSTLMSSTCRNSSIDSDEEDDNDSLPHRAVAGTVPGGKSGGCGGSGECRRESAQSPDAEMRPLPQSRGGVVFERS